jgi:hypothetical protein
VEVAGAEVDGRLEQCGEHRIWVRHLGAPSGAGAKAVWSVEV